MLASRIAWALATGSWPHGPVRHRDGDETNFRFGNLVLTKRGPHPFTQSNGGKASSLERRTNTSTTLLKALAEHPGSTVAGAVAVDRFGV